MALVRVCLGLLLVLCLDSVAGKPIFDFLCDWMCDDNDDDISTTTAADDYDFCDCRPLRRRTTTTTRAPITPMMMSGQNPNGMNFMIMPDGSNTVVRLLNNGANGWEMQIGPRPAANSVATTTTSTVTTVASGTTAAGATTAAPGATTAAPGATTTAPGAATTAAGATTAATTAASGK